MSENGEPNTPAELARERVARTVKDAWLAMHELTKLENDPIAQPFIRENHDDLWSIKFKTDLVLSHMSASEMKVAS